ncbi:MAG: hypothetical protein GF421_07830 [Candidatus Aminicenantes bacterium]|nr:hypothetical protein [Candidatus Aminicenantes bacterium]
MRKLTNIIIMFVVLVPLSFAGSNSDYYEDSYARMSYVKGDVFIQRAEDLGYEEGVVNLALIQGDKVGTREGRAEVHLGESNYIRININTQIELVQMPDQAEDVTAVHLLSGDIFVRVDFLNEQKIMGVHSPDGSFYILDKGLYYFSTIQNNQTEIRVFEGQAEAAGEEGSLLLGSEEKLVISNGRFLSQPTYFYPSFSGSFAEWNSSRDAFYSRYARGTRYLPDGMNEYEAELAYYGDWRYHDRYGYVWIPQRISVSWRPYLNGRWVWYPIIGWTWVSYEPWGWCVSHYGRWHWSVSIGWYWIPTRRWSPAWVYWYHGPSYVGWCPLSYYGYPGVIINNHYYGNYYHNTYPSTSRALVVVQKNQLQARNVSKVALSSLKASKLERVSMSPAQPKIRPAVNKTSADSLRAAKMFSDTRVRGVSKVYSSGRAVNSIQGLKGLAGRKSATDPTTSHKVSRTSKTGRNRTLYSSRATGIVNRGSRSGNKGATGIRTYPSRKSRSSSRSSQAMQMRSRSTSQEYSNAARPSRSARSKQRKILSRYPSRMSSSSRTASRDSRNIRSTQRRNINSPQRRSIANPSNTRTSSSSARRSPRKRSSVPQISSRANSRASSSSRRVVSRSTSSSRSVVSSRRNSRSRVKRPVSSSRRISRPRATRSSSSRIRSSSSRSRSSSKGRTQRSSRSRSSSKSRSAKRSKKK